jgi:hydroxymethylglutaryl-CoA lyase
VAALAPHEISLADTIGVATPLDVEQRFAALAEIAPEPVARAHFHDTRNTGIANAVAAQRAGVRVFDTALAGIGGCPFAPRATGNLATEDLVYCFERMGLSTGFDLDRLIADAGWLTGRLDTRGSSSLRHAGGFPRPDRASLTPQVLEATS